MYDVIGNKHTCSRSRRCQKVLIEVCLLTDFSKIVIFVIAEVSTRTGSSPQDIVGMKMATPLEGRSHGIQTNCKELRRTRNIFIFRTSYEQCNRSLGYWSGWPEVITAAFKARKRPSSMIWEHRRFLRMDHFSWTRSTSNTCYLFDGEFQRTSWEWKWQMLLRKLALLLVLTRKLLDSIATTSKFIYQNLAYNSIASTMRKRWIRKLVNVWERMASGRLHQTWSLQLFVSMSYVLFALH